LREPNYFGDRPNKPSGPDYLKKRPTTDLSSAHEKETAARMGGTRVPGSGAVQNRGRGRRVTGRPGDVRGDKELQELKATDKVDETRIQLTWLRKIAFEALTQGKYPVVNMRFTRLKPPAPEDWVLIPAEVYAKLKGQEL